MSAWCMEASTAASVHRTASSSTGSSVASSRGSMSSSAATLGSAHSTEFFWSLANLYQDGSMCDVEVVVDEDNVFRAHRIVLSAASPFFRAMFTSDVLESHSQRIRLSGNVVEPTSFKVILDYIYSRQLKLSKDNVCQVLRDACYLLMSDVEGKCCTYIARTLSQRNCFEFMQIAGVLSSNSLTDAVLRFVCRQGFAVFARSSELMKIDFLQLRGILSSSLVGSMTEDRLLDIALQWVNYEGATGEDRKRLLLNLVKMLKLQLCQPMFIASKLNEPIIKNDDVCREIFQTTLRQFEEVAPWPIAPRGGFIYANTEPNVLSYYDPAIRKWSNALTAPYNMELASVSLFALDEINLGIVGSDSRVDSSRWDDLGLGSHVAIFDTRSRTWRTLPSLTTVRCRPAVVAVQYVDVVVAAGGVTESSDILFCEHLETCEVLQLSKQKWKPFSPLIGQGGDGLRLVTAQDRIFALGGVGANDGNGGRSVSNKMSSVAISVLVNDDYEVVSDAGWSEYPPMRNGRTHFGAAVVGDSIFAVGGHNEYEMLAEVEAFDLDRGVWLQREPLPRPAPFISAVAYGGLLNCLVCYTTDTQSGLAPYEMLTYDPRDHRWHSDGSFIPPPCHMGIVWSSMAVLSS